MPFMFVCRREKVVHYLLQNLCFQKLSVSVVHCALFLSYSWHCLFCCVSLQIFFLFSLTAYITGKKQPTGKKHLLVLEKKVEVAVFEICGENKGSVERAEAWLKDLILKEQEEKCISDRAIKMFGDAEIEKLKDLQERLPISICLEMKQSPPFIMIAGIPRAILTAYEEITLLIEKIKEQSMAELAKNTVEWQYSTNGDTFVAFDSVTNLHLEDAKINDGTHVEIQIQGKSYKADVNEMYATDGQGSRISIKRLVKDEGKERLTCSWHGLLAIWVSIGQHL